MKRANTFNTHMATLALLAGAIMPVNAESGFYLGLGYGLADYTGGDYRDYSTRSGRPSDSEPELTLYSGYQINPYFAFEVEYSRIEDLNDQYPEDTLPPGVAGIGNYRHHIEGIAADLYALTVVGQYPLSDKIALMALVGYGAIDQDRRLSGGFSYSGPSWAFSDYSEDEEGLILGLGLKYSFNSHIESRLQWSTKKLGPIDIDTTRLSLEWHF